MKNLNFLPSKTKSCEGVALPNLNGPSRVQLPLNRKTDPPQPLPPTKKHRRKEGLLNPTTSGSEIPLQNPTNRSSASALQASEAELPADSFPSSAWGRRKKYKRQVQVPSREGWSNLLGRGGFLVILIFLVLASMASTTFAQQPDSTHQLQQYLQIAAENNPKLRASFYKYLAALQEAPQVGSLPDPAVAFGYFIAPIETRLGAQTARLSVSQMFPWFGTLDARADAAVLEAKAEFAKFQDQRNRLFYRIKEKWYSLYILNHKISIVEKNISILETLVDITLQQYETGMVSQADVLQAQIELENLRIKKQELIDDRKVLVREINELLNTDELDIAAAVPSTLKPAQLSLTKERLMQLVLENNPVLNRLELQEEAAEQSIEAARLSGYPKFGIGATYMFIDERPVTIPHNGQNAFMAMLTVKIPLFREKYEAKKTEARLRQKAVQSMQIAVVNRLVTRVKETLSNYREATRDYRLYSETQIRRTEQALEILLQEYATGGADFEEVLRLQRQLLRYRLAKAKALGRQHVAVAKLEYLYGKYNVDSEEIGFRSNE